MADCSFACPGDPSESCGAGDRLNLYTRTTDPTAPTLTAYSDRGCYAEPSNARALASQTTRAADMTVAKCATFCGNAGYTLFGLEYYTEVSNPAITQKGPNDGKLMLTIFLVLLLQFPDAWCCTCRRHGLQVPLRRQLC